MKYTDSRRLSNPPRNKLNRFDNGLALGQHLISEAEMIGTFLRIEAGHRRERR